jgi:membrane protease subunit HflK
MAWNEPGNGDGRDPWGNRRGEGGPPDLDEVVRKMQDKLGGLFGGRRGGSGGVGQRRGGGGGAGIILIVVLLGVILLGYQMCYIIDQPERGVVLRFGRYVTTLEPGFQIRFPYPIEKVYKVNIDRLRNFTHGASMLTQDENIVDIEVAVQYRIKDPKDYLFKVFNPPATVRQVAETSVREVIGKRELDFVLTEGRAAIAQRVQELMQEVVDQYLAGIIVTSVNMQPAKPPDAVKSAFDDAIKAREDEQRFINEAEAYRNEIIPIARGAAARQREEAKAYKDQVIAQAEGEASRFTQLLAEYQRAPDVTRERLYLEAMESVLGGSTKVLMDSDAANSLMYLPLDKILEHSAAAPARSERPNVITSQPPPSAGSDESRGTSRGRERP